MSDFARWAQPSVIAVLAITIIIIVVSAVVLRQAEVDEKSRMAVRRGRNILLLLFVIIFTWRILAAASVNDTPRSKLDRSDVDSQSQKFEERANNHTPPKESK